MWDTKKHKISLCPKIEKLEENGMPWGLPIPCVAPEINGTTRTGGYGIFTLAPGANVRSGYHE